MEGFKVTIIDGSKEFTAREKIKVKDTSAMVLLNDAVKTGDVIIDVDGFAVLSVENPKAESGEYTQTVLIDKNGTYYVTGSHSLHDSFIDIYADMKDEQEPWSLRVYTKPSKNFSGNFITCTIV